MIWFVFTLDSVAIDISQLTDVLWASGFITKSNNYITVFGILFASFTSTLSSPPSFILQFSLFSIFFSMLNFTLTLALAGLSLLLFLPLWHCPPPLSPLLWSYLHPGTWLQIITREVEKNPQFLSAATAAIHCRVLNDGETLIVPHHSLHLFFFSPFLHFLSMLSPTAGAFWRVKRPSSIWMPHFEFAEQRL